ncbi:MAG: helix-turn-helix transcriptional regulator [Planctomycetota bacterium]|jgi:predicted ArsR family transcriptional regulator
MEHSVSHAKRRLLEKMKFADAMRATTLAQELNLTDVAVRQHLLALETQGLVQQRKLPAEGRGRPAVLWTLTPSAHQLFPDRHADLTVSLISAIREAAGEGGLEKVIESRARLQIDAYLATMPPKGNTNLDARVRSLAEIRSREGYMAEVARDGPSWLLLEHHCPICDAAKSCVGFCHSEAYVFRQVLPDAHVERIKHLLDEDDRCVYRITPREIV